MKFDVDISLEECQPALILNSGFAQLTIPNEIGHLMQATLLSFIYGRGSMPSSISCLTNLEYLYIYAPAYTGAVPDTFLSLTKLTFLLLSETKMQDEFPVIFEFNGNS